MKRVRNINRDLSNARESNFKVERERGREKERDEGRKINEEGVRE